MLGGVEPVSLMARVAADVTAGTRVRDLHLAPAAAAAHQPLEQGGAFSHWTHATLPWTTPVGA
jgi:hypothetical protein